MTIKLANNHDLNRIDTYVSRCDLSNTYHDYRWGSVIRKSFGHEYFYLLSENHDGNIKGVLPLVHMRSFSFGNFIVSMPFFNYGGVCAEDEAIRNRLFEEAIRIAKDRKADHIEFREEIPLQNDFPAKTSKVSMRLDLPVSADMLWKSFPSKLRSQIRVPQKAGMVAKIGKAEELGSFYEVFCINMRYLGTPVYPKKFFSNILEQFPGNTWICSVYADNRPVASGFLVAFKNRVEIPWASSIRQYNRQSPNMLLYWSCLQFACEQGYAMFDFGRSTKGESTYKFKEQWGAKPYPMRWSYWLRDGVQIPDMTPGNRKYHLAINVWKKLPLPVTTILGPRIVRNIP